jgi:hypothetical protein
MLDVGEPYYNFLNLLQTEKNKDFLDFTFLLGLMLLFQGKLLKMELSLS